jgi:nucleotide-binding universal stress UspA family protein
MAVCVVIGTDGSDDAVAAASRAVEVLASDATVHLISVAEQPDLASGGMVSGFAGGVATPHEVDRAWTAATDVATAALERTRPALGARPVETHVERGDPGPVLCQRAEALGADVIAVGSRGRGAIRRMLLGSVSAHVVNNAPCPVLVLRSGTVEGTAGAGDQ